MKERGSNKPTSQWEAAAEVIVGMYIADIISYDSGLVVFPYWFNLHSNPSTVLTLLFSCLKIKSSTLNVDVLRGGNVSYVPTCCPAHMDTGLSPGQGSSPRVAGAWGWAASHTTPQRGREDANHAALSRLPSWA